MVDKPITKVFRITSKWWNKFDQEVKSSVTLTENEGEAISEATKKFTVVEVMYNDLGWQPLDIWVNGFHFPSLTVVPDDSEVIPSDA